MLYYGKYTLVGLMGQFFKRTWLGRFILGIFLGMSGLTGVIVLLMPLTKRLTAALLTLAAFKSWWTNIGLSEIVPALALAILFAILVGTLLLFFSFRRWEGKLILFMLPISVALVMFFALLKYQQGADQPFIRSLLYDLAGVIYLPFSLGCGIRLAMAKPRFGEGKFLRGAGKLEGTPAQIERRLLALAKQGGRRAPQGIRIWQKVCLPYALENQHILIVGSPGSGKTQITHPVIKQVTARGDKAIIWDVKGTYIQALAGEPGVALLAPWDKRSLKWRPGADILRPLDCHQASHVLIPGNPKEPQPYFNTAARNILEALLIQLDAGGGKWGWQDIWRCAAQGKADLHSFLQRTQEGRTSAAFIEGGSKSGRDVYSMLISHLKPISWLAKAWGNEGVSLRGWLKDPDSKTLIIGGMVENEELATLTARLAIQILVNEVLAMPDDLNRRVWLFLDELATLGSSESLLKAFSTGRSKGLCVVAGIQDIGKIEHLYSHELAKSIVNSFATNIFLRCSDAATSQWVSNILGEQEAWDLVGETKSAAFDESKNRNVRYKPLFMPAEIANLPNLSGVLRVSGWPVPQVQWPLIPIPQTFPRAVDAAWVSQKAKLDDTPPRAHAEQVQDSSWEA